MIRTIDGVRYSLEPMGGKCTATRSRREGIRCRTVGGKTYRLVEQATATPTRAAQRSRASTPRASTPRSSTPRASTPRASTRASTKRARPKPKQPKQPKQPKASAALPSMPIESEPQWSEPEELSVAVTLPPPAAAEKAPSRGLEIRNILPWALAGGLGLLLLKRRAGASSAVPPLSVPPLPRDQRSGAQPMDPLVLLPELPSDPPPGALDPLPKKDPSPPTSAPSKNEKPTAVPGYQRAKNADVTSAMVRSAVDVLSRARADAKAAGWSGSGGCPDTGATPCGVVEYFVDPDSGRKYAVLIEPHYHEPGGALKPWGPHPGASVFVQ